MVLDAHCFLRDIMFGNDYFNPYAHCHYPIIVRDGHVRLGDTISQFQVKPMRQGDDVVDKDVILLWNNEKRIITGSDILGRLLRGIVKNESVPFKKLG